MSRVGRYDDSIWIGGNMSRNGRNYDRVLIGCPDTLGGYCDGHALLICGRSAFVVGGGRYSCYAITAVCAASVRGRG